MATAVFAATHMKATAANAVSEATHMKVTAANVVFGETHMKETAANVKLATTTAAAVALLHASTATSSEPALIASIVLHARTPVMELTLVLLEVLVPVENVRTKLPAEVQVTLLLAVIEVAAPVPPPLTAAQAEEGL